MILLFFIILCSITSNPITASEAIDHNTHDFKTCPECQKCLAQNPPTVPDHFLEKNFVDAWIENGEIPKDYTHRYDEKRKLWYIPEYTRDEEGNWHCVEDLKIERYKPRGKRTKSGTNSKEKISAQAAAAALVIKKSSPYPDEACSADSPQKDSSKSKGKGPFSGDGSDKKQKKDSGKRKR